MPATTIRSRLERAVAAYVACLESPTSTSVEKDAARADIAKALTVTEWIAVVALLPPK